jgi:hypothetical protein
MARIYISSTSTDLREFRVEVYKAIRRLGHLSVAMEDWAVSDLPPLEESLRAVRESDVVIVLVAWRYGYIPPLQHVSITELEVKTAREAGIPCLLFLVPDNTSWPRAFVDTDTSRIQSFRRSLLEQFVVAYFHNPEELALRVAHALHNWTSEGSSGPPAVPTAVEGAEAPGPEVFLSYAHEDTAMAASIAARLGNERWSVFWDRNIPVGLTWDDIVEAALDRAKCVVVLWSSRSRDSEWVRIEANEGAERGILAPALLEDIKIPLRFRRIQAANLIGWTSGVHEAPGLVALIGAIRRCLGSALTNPQPIGVSEPVLQPLTVISSQGPLAHVPLSDEKVKDVVSHLQQLHQQSGMQTLAASDLLPELDLLFDRKTLRRESLRGCVEQRWDDRLDAAYQTLKVLEAYRRNVREAAPDKWNIYAEMLTEVDRFCMQTGGLLFEPAVDYGAIKKYIGRSAFKANLPKKKKKFDVDDRKLPVISNEINDAIETHRLRAIQLMDRLLGRASQANAQQG